MCRSEHISVVNLLVVAVSWPVRGVLSSGPLPGSRWVTIHLCGPPEGFGRAAQPSIRPCSGWGLPSRPGRPGRWCALTAPFHPCLCLTLPTGHRRSALCCPKPSGHPDLALASTLPGGAPTFLSDLTITAVTRPAHRRSNVSWSVVDGCPWTVSTAVEWRPDLDSEWREARRENRIPPRT